jgi:Transglutaminase-like superfamily
MTNERTFGLDRSRASHAPVRSHPPSDRILFLIALLTIASRVGLWLTSFRRLHRSLARIARPSGSPDPGEVDRIGWAVWSAARFGPGATCLPQALAA